MILNKSFFTTALLSTLTLTTLASTSYGYCGAAGASNEGISYLIVNNQEGAEDIYSLSTTNSLLCCTSNVVLPGESATCYLPLYANTTANIIVSKPSGNNCEISLETRQPGMFSNPTTNYQDTSCQYKFDAQTIADEGGGWYRYRAVTKQYNS